MISRTPVPAAETASGNESSMSFDDDARYAWRMIFAFSAPVRHLNAVPDIADEQPDPAPRHT